MKNNKGGVAHILVILLIVVAIIAAGLYLFSATIDPPSVNDNVVNQETSDPVMAEPVSDDTSLDTIEAELDATIVGSPETEIDAMSEDASTL